MKYQVARNFDEQCPAVRRGRRCKFVIGHFPEYKHQDSLGKNWPTKQRSKKRTRKEK